MADEHKPFSIVDLITGIGAENVKVQFLHACMSNITKCRDGFAITFDTDMLNAGNVATNTGPVGIILWVDRDKLAEVKKANGIG